MGNELHHAVLNQLGQNGALNWSKACPDSVSIQAKRGLTGSNPADRGKAGTAYHLRVAADG